MRLETEGVKRNCDRAKQKKNEKNDQKMNKINNIITLMKKREVCPAKGS